MNETIVRFYILQDTEITARLSFACTLCRKALQNGEKTAVVCADEATAAQFGEGLWLDHPTAFITNTRLNDPLVEKAAVQLVVPPERGAAVDVLIDLGDETQVDIPHNCKSVFEVVIQRENILAITRKRYLHYRRRGFSPEKIAIDA